MDFSEIYQRYAHDVHRFSLYLSGNYELAEDLTAETFVQMCGPTDLRVDSVGGVSVRHRTQPFSGHHGGQDRPVAVSDAAETVDPVPSPARIAEDRLTLTVVLKAIQRLPEHQREALVLSGSGALRYDQISAILGCSVAAVKVRIDRARPQLRSELRAPQKTWKT